MTTDDERLPAPTTGKRRPGKKKRTRGVGRTGARFPSTTALDDNTPAHDTSADNTPADNTDEPPPSTAETDRASAPRHSLPPANTSPGAPATPAPSARLDHGTGPHGHAWPSPAVDSDVDSDVVGGLSAAHPASHLANPGALPDSGHDGADSEGDTDEGFVGRTGARFGPYSARKAKRAKDDAVPDDGAGTAITPPGEPTPEQSAERTMPLIKPWAGALVRPYAHTGGRTRSSHDLALEALVSSSGRGATTDNVLATQHRRMIVEMCEQPRSVAEVAALLSVPLGVARVLLGDLATAGVVTVHPTAGSTGDGEPDLDFMQRVLVGLRRL